MIELNNDTSVTQAKVVWPFYAYAAFSFLVACILLFVHSDDLLGHYFQPQLLAIVHSMAIAWATMIILGASYQLLPVIAGKKLYSEVIAKWSFYLAALSIPFLIFGFYHFSFDVKFLTAALVLLIAFILFLWNVYQTVFNAAVIQGDYILSASVYLVLTILLGTLLAYNFRFNVLEEGSLSYLKLHAHVGIIGWFLFLIIGVGSKLIPMFLISKYQNESLLKRVYYLLHASILSFFISQTFYKNLYIEYLSILGFILIAMSFVYYIYQAYQHRLKKSVDAAMKSSNISVISILAIIIIAGLMIGLKENKPGIAVSYGFVIFFGWISLLILGMTFKTLPFIIWNAQYADVSGKTPNPKEMYSHKIFSIMLIVYVLGLLSALIGINFMNEVLLKSSSLMLVLAAILYNINVWKILTHKKHVA